MTPEVIAYTVGLIIPLFFTFFPKVKEWYEALDSTYKGLIILALFILIGLGPLVPVCLGWFVTTFPSYTCNQVGVEQAVNVTIAAVAGYATTYLPVARPASKKLAARMKE